MTIKEYYRQAYKEMRGKPPKEKWEYFWEYFKWHFSIGLLVLVMLIMMVVTIVNHRNNAFAGVFLNAIYDANDQGFLQDYYEYTDLNTKKDEALFYTNFTVKGDGSKFDSDQIYGVAVKIMSNELDFIAGQPDIFQIFAYNTSVLLDDLREHMTEEDLANYHVYYIDGAFRTKLETALGDEKPKIEDYPDPYKPELMEDPIPVGIDITYSKMLSGRIYNPDAKTFIGIVSNTKRVDKFMEFLDFLWSDGMLKENAFAGVFTNSIIDPDQQGFLQDYYGYTGLDTEKQEARFYTNFLLKGDASKADNENFYGIWGKITNNEIDFIAGQSESFSAIAYNPNAFLMDLRQYLDAETLARYSDRLYYIDGEVFRNLKDARPENYPDPRKPELMEDPIPVGIDISDSAMLSGRIYNADAETYIGVTSNAKQPEKFMEFLDFLWSTK